MLSDPSMLPKAFSKPYSIVITETISPDATGYCYRVEGLSSDANADLDIFGYGTLEECNEIFDVIKNTLIKVDLYVREVGCRSSRILIPRQMLVNYSPYEVWKRLYINLQSQDKIAEADKVLLDIRSTRPIGIRQWTS